MHAQDVASLLTGIFMMQACDMLTASQTALTPYFHYTYSRNYCFLLRDDAAVQGSRTEQIQCRERGWDLSQLAPFAPCVFAMPYNVS